jgi:hypothetical protein
MKKVFLLVLFLFAINLNAQVEPSLNGSTSYDAIVEFFDVVSDDGSTLTQYINKKGYQIVAVIFPSSYGSTTANILYSNSQDSSSFTKINDDEGNSITAISGIETGIPIRIAPIDGFVNYNYAKIELPSASSGADTIKIGLQKLYKQ